MKKMKEQALLGLNARTSRTVDRSGADLLTPAKKHGSGGASSAAKDINMVQHAISSLSGVRDSKKFGEVLEKMFVPTVQAYRQKEKDRPFRRPTMNPCRSKGSTSPGQRAAAR